MENIIEVEAQINLEQAKSYSERLTQFSKIYNKIHQLNDDQKRSWFAELNRFIEQNSKDPEQLSDNQQQLTLRTIARALQACIQPLTSFQQICLKVDLLDLKKLNPTITLVLINFMINAQAKQRTIEIEGVHLASLKDYQLFDLTPEEIAFCCQHVCVDHKSLYGCKRNTVIESTLSLLSAEQVNQLADMTLKGLSSAKEVERTKAKKTTQWLLTSDKLSAKKTQSLLLSFCKVTKILEYTYITDLLNNANAMHEIIKCIPEKNAESLMKSPGKLKKSHVFNMIATALFCHLFDAENYSYNYRNPLNELAGYIRDKLDHGWDDSRVKIPFTFATCFTTNSLEKFVTYPFFTEEQKFKLFKLNQEKLNTERKIQFIHYDKRKELSANTVNMMFSSDDIKTIKDITLILTLIEKYYESCSDLIKRLINNFSREEQADLLIKHPKELSKYLEAPLTKEILEGNQQIRNKFLNVLDNKNLSYYLKELFLKTLQVDWLNLDQLFYLFNECQHHELAFFVRLPKEKQNILLSKAIDNQLFSSKTYDLIKFLIPNLDVLQYKKQLLHHFEQQLPQLSKEPAKKVAKNIIDACVVLLVALEKSKQDITLAKKTEFCILLINNIGNTHGLPTALLNRWINQLDSSELLTVLKRISDLELRRWIVANSPINEINNEMYELTLGPNEQVSVAVLNKLNPEKAKSKLLSLEQYQSEEQFKNNTDICCALFNKINDEDRHNMIVKWITRSLYATRHQEQPGGYAQNTWDVQRYLPYKSLTALKWINDYYAVNQADQYLPKYVNLIYQTFRSFQPRDQLLAFKILINHAEHLSEQQSATLALQCLFRYIICGNVSENGDTWGFNHTSGGYEHLDKGSYGEHSLNNRQLKYHDEYADQMFSDNFNQCLSELISCNVFSQDDIDNTYTLFVNEVASFFKKIQEEIPTSEIHKRLNQLRNDLINDKNNHRINQFLIPCLDKLSDHFDEFKQLQLSIKAHANVNPIAKQISVPKQENNHIIDTFEMTEIEEDNALSILFDLYMLDVISNPNKQQDPVDSLINYLEGLCALDQHSVETRINTATQMVQFFCDLTSNIDNIRDLYHRLFTVDETQGARKIDLLLMKSNRGFSFRHYYFLNFSDNKKDQYQECGEQAIHIMKIIQQRLRSLTNQSLLDDDDNRFLKQNSQ